MPECQLYVLKKCLEKSNHGESKQKIQAAENLRHNRYQKPEHLNTSTEKPQQNPYDVKLRHSRTL